MIGSTYIQEIIVSHNKYIDSFRVSAFSWQVLLLMKIKWTDKPWVIPGI